MTRHNRFEIRRTRNNQFRGYIIAKNGEIVWTTPETYTRKASVLKAIRVVRDAISDFHIDDKS